MRHITCLLTASLLTLGVCAAAARADLKVVAEVTEIENGTPQKPHIETTYIKNEMTRTDIQGGGPIVIHDLTSDVYFTINPLNRTCATFSARSKSAREAAKSGTISSLLRDNSNITGKADVKPGGKTKTIAGKKAKNYLYTAAMRVALKGVQGQYITLNIQGEQWVTEEIKLSPAMERMRRDSLLRQMGPLASAGRPLVDKISKVRGYPLSSKETVTVVIAKPGTPGRREKTVSTTNVTLVSEEPLDDKLFLVPDGYREVAPDPRIVQEYTLSN